LVCILALDGGLRISEIHDLEFEDLTVYDDHIKVVLKKRKTDRKGEGSCYFSMKRTFEQNCPIFLFKKYCALIPFEKKGNLFRQFRNDKYTQQVLGKNSIAAIPSIIAKYLNLPNPKSFTGHSLRRTASTWLAESGVSIEILKKFGGWSSDNAAREYVDKSDAMKRKLGNLIANEEEKPQKLQKLDPDSKIEEEIVKPIVIDTKEKVDLVVSNLCNNLVAANSGNCTFNIYMK